MEHMSFFQFAFGGLSGMNKKSAAVQIAAIKARKPHFLPITPMTNAR